MKTGAVTSFIISELSSLSATREAKKLPTTATAASFRDLKGDIRMQKHGSRFLAINVAALHPMERPKTKMSYSRTFKTETAKSNTRSAFCSILLESACSYPNRPYPGYSTAITLQLSLRLKQLMRKLHVPRSSAFPWK